MKLTVLREVAAANAPGVHHMFRSHKQTPKGSQTRLYVETADAMAGMLIAANDQPLNAQQQQAEKDHLYWLSGSPDQLKKKHAREKDDAERTLRIVLTLSFGFGISCLFHRFDYRFKFRRSQHFCERFHISAKTHQGRQLGQRL